MTALSPITEHLCHAIDQAAENIQLIGDQINEAADLAVGILLSDKKMLICGSGLASPLAQILTTGLMDQHEFERPGLPALNLSNDTATMSSILRDHQADKVFAKQIRALGAEGDCLICCTLSNPCPELTLAAETAIEQGMSVIMINGSPLKAQLPEGGTQLKEVFLNAQSLSNGIELSAFSINALIRCIESKLFGVPLSSQP